MKLILFVHVQCILGVFKIMRGLKANQQTIKKLLSKLLSPLNVTILAYFSFLFPLQTLDMGLIFPK